MDERERNEAAASPSRPILLGGKTYLLAPCTLSQAASIGNVARKRLARQTPLSLLVGDPAFRELPREAQVEAAREASKVQVHGTQSVDGNALLDQMMSPEVLAFAVWLLARKEHPGLALEDVATLITEANAAAVWEDFNEASGMLALGPLGIGQRG